MSRQTERQMARAELKLAVSANKLAYRKTAKRALLERQSEREKSGFYSGTPLHVFLTGSRSRVTKRKVKKGQEFGRIIETETIGAREYSYHATKGWRSHRSA